MARFQGACLGRGRHHRHPDAPGQGRVQGRAEDQLGRGVDLLADVPDHLFDLVQGQVVAAGDVDEERPDLVEGHALQQGIAHGGAGGLDGPELALGLADAHQRPAHVLDHDAHVGEVEVDQAGADDEVGHRPHAVAQDPVGQSEGLGDGGLAVDHLEQVLVGDDQQGIQMALQVLQTRFRHPHAPRALEGEGLGHDADGEQPRLAGGAGDHRGAAGAGAPAHAGGDEDQVEVLQGVEHLLQHFLRRLAPDLGLGAGAEAAGGVAPELDAVLAGRGLERLGVGVGDDEGDPLEAGLHHVADRVAAGPADAQHGDPRQIAVRGLARLEIEDQDCFPCGFEPAAAGPARLERHGTIVGMDFARNQDADKTTLAVIYLY